MEAGRRVKEEGKDNELITLIANDPDFNVSEDDIKNILKPELYTGRASRQVDNYLKNFVNPVLEARKDLLGARGEVKV